MPWRIQADAKHRRTNTQQSHSVKYVAKTSISNLVAMMKKGVPGHTVYSSSRMKSKHGSHGPVRSEPASMGLRSNLRRIRHRIRNIQIVEIRPKSPWQFATTFSNLGDWPTPRSILPPAPFVLSPVPSGDGVPDIDIWGAALEIACTLQMIDNSHQLALYYLNAYEQRRKTLQGLTHSATSTTPQGLLAPILASSGTFLLPNLLSAAQLAASRHWPDSDVPRDLEQIKVIVNIAGAAATSIVAALKHWRAGRLAVAVELSDVVSVQANETTALRVAGQKQPSNSGASVKRAGAVGRVGRRVCGIFDVELIDINMKKE